MKQEEWQKEFDEEQYRIHNICSFSDDESEDEEEQIEDSQSFEKKRNKDNIIERLNKSLKDNEITPYDV